MSDIFKKPCFKNPFIEKLKKPRREKFELKLL